jgi:hypothetical protein
MIWDYMTSGSNDLGTKVIKCLDGRNEQNEDNDTNL